MRLSIPPRSEYLTDDLLYWNFELANFVGGGAVSLFLTFFFFISGSSSSSSFEDDSGFVSSLVVIPDP